MPQVVFSPAALKDLERLQRFLQQKNTKVAKRAAAVIVKSVQKLGRQPRMGRPAEDLPPAFREWVIHFGNSGYIARYRYDGGDMVVILAIRHAREAGFSALPD